MKCPSCLEHLFTLRTVTASNGKACDLKCLRCGFRATSITLVEESPQQRIERTMLLGRTQKLKARTGATARTLVRNGMLVLPEAEKTEAPS